jgi:hypothetical protein
MWILVLSVLFNVAQCQFGNNYSGFINVNETRNHNLFYWAFESQNSISDPVVLWMNGMPDHATTELYSKLHRRSRCVVYFLWIA